MDVTDFYRYFAGLLIVMGLLAGFAVIVRRGWLPGGFPALANFSAHRQERRLAVKESLILDPRRRVVIVKADGEEHVLLLGPERETVLSTRPAAAEPVFAPEMPETQDTDVEVDIADLGVRREASA